MKSIRCVALLASVAFCLPFLLAFAPHDDPSAPDSLNHAAAPGIGGNGPYNAENIVILGHLTLEDMGSNGSGNVMSNDCWGWTDSQTGNEYAICGMTNATAFVDVSDPTDPKFLGRLLTQTGNATWRDMKVYNDHVFIVSDGNSNHGMQVFDLTELRTVDPENPQIFSNTAHYDDVDSAHNIAINEATGFAYIVGSNRASGGLHVVNIQNPTNPVEAGNYGGDGYVHDCQVVTYDGPDTTYQGMEIAFCCNGRSGSDDDRFSIVDVTNKSNMVRLSSTGYPQPGYSHQGWLSGDHRYFYLGDEFDENAFGGLTRILVWDCLDLENPVYLGFATGPTNAIDHNMYIRDDKLFLSNYSAGMRVFQIDPQNLLNLEQIAFVDTYLPDNDTDFDGVWSNYPFYESGIVVISDRQGGMFVVQLTQLEFDFPNGRPELIEPDGQAEFDVIVSGFDGTPEPGTGTLHVDLGNGFQSFPMNEISSNVYEAVFPPTECGSVVNYYVSAMSTSGVEVCNPPNAPEMTFSATSADSVSLPFADDFEANQGWTVTGNADAGQWERGVPAGDGDRGDPTLDGDGSGSCFLTGNQPDDSDVDSGSTVLTSPLMDAVGDGTAVSTFISYYRWYTNDFGNAPASDIFVIEISNNDGETWAEIETVGPGGNEVSGGWFLKTFEIDDFVAPTNQMRIRFTASDLGDGSVVEAAVDGVEIMLVQCDDDVLLGDVDLNGVVNLLDVAPFVALLTNGEFQLEADMNQDGVVNLLDVELFVQAIGG